MPRNFACPTCGAPLRYEGDDPTVQCAYCNNTLIVPEALRPGGAEAPGDAPAPDARPFSFDLAALLNQAGQFGEVARRVQAGQKIEAIKLYRELTGAGLKEARDAVEQLAAGQVLQVSHLIVRSAGARSHPDALAEVRRLLAAGQKIEAIKLYRQHTGLGLKEARDAVEALEAGLAPPPGEAATADPADAAATLKLAEVRNVLAAGDKIEAIKRFREHFGVGLRDAKEAVEAMERGQPVPPWTLRPAVRPAPSGAQARPAGCLWVVAGIAALGLCIALTGAAPLMLTGSFRQAVSAVQTDPAVTGVLGEPVEVVWWRLAWGQMRCGSTCSTNYSFYIAGPRGGARVQVLSDSTGGFPFVAEGEWDLDLRVHFDEGAAASASTLQLRGTATPAPTLSLAQADATAGAQARATRQAAETATAAAAERTRQAEATEAAAAEQTRAVARETAAAEAAAQGLLAAQADWATTVISETYRNNANFWPTDRYDDGSLVLEPAITDGVYRWGVNPASGGHYWNLLPGAVPPVTDFVASVDVRLTQGQGGVYVYGLAFRAEGRDYGLFGLTNDGRFRVLGVYGSAIYQLYDFGSDAIRAEPGAFNRLTVRALGPDFVFQINGQTVFVWNQPDLNDGRVGLGVDIGREGADAVIEFDNFEVVTP